MTARRAIAAAIIALALACSPACAETARFIFIGDVMAHMPQVDGARRAGGEYDFSPSFRRVLPLFWNGCVTANLETVFGGESDGGYTGYPMFNTPDALAKAMRDAGIDAATIANNHILDRRERGLERTTRVLDEAGIAWTGARMSADAPFEPLIAERGGVRVAMINFTYGTNVPPKKDASARVNYIKSDDIREAIRSARAASADIVVACLHWGDEYVLAPNARQRAVADLCVAEGVDLIVGTHPHVLQPIEVREDERRASVIAWSLGNFVSNQRKEPRERSAVLAVEIDKGDGGASISRVSVAPTWVSSRKVGGRRLHEVVYAGTGGKFSHTGLPKAELDRARAAGASVLKFLGARGEPDEEGFYTVWSADEKK